MEEVYTKALNYSYERLDEETFNELVNSLTETKTIAELNVAKNKIIVDSAAAFASALKVNQSLTHLNLSENDVVECIVTALFQHETITHLDLYKSDIAEGLLEQIIMTKHLQYLNVSSIFVYRPSTVMDGAKLSYYSKQKRVIGPLTLLLLTTSTLKFLNVSQNKIDSDDARELFNAMLFNKTLTELDISENKIDSLCISELAEMLKHNKSLTRLNISQNQLTSADLKEIAQALLHNKTLTDLDVSLNLIEPCEDTGIALELLFKNETLTALNFCGNTLGDDILRGIANEIMHNTTLTKLFLGETISLSVAQDFALALKHNITLSSFSLQITLGMGGQTNLGVVIAKEITTTFLTNNVITCLDFSYYTMGADGARYVAEFLKHSHTITDLNLRWNFIHDDGCEYIAEALAVNKSLLNLNLEYHRSFTDGLVALWHALKINRTLVHLDLSVAPDCKYTEIGENELIEVLRCNPVVNSLEVGGCIMTSDTLEKLTDAFQQNTTMLNFQLYHSIYNKPSTPQIRFYMDRNRNLLRKMTGIANFIHNHKRDNDLILSHISKKDFQEFEEYPGISGLIKSLRQYDFCESEAIKAINYVHFFIKVNFFEITGILTNPFCRLPTEICARMASYLKLKDIH